MTHQYNLLSSTDILTIYDISVALDLALEGELLELVTACVPVV